jgi:hypothetical protein
MHQSNGAGPAAPGQVWPHQSHVRPQLSQARQHHGRPQLARAGRSQARAGRSWLEPVPARPEPDAAGHSRPHLARSRPGRTCRCARAYQMPRLGSTTPTIPRTSLGWTRNVDSMSVGSKAKIGSTWIDGPTLNRRNRHQGVILDVPQHCRCITR